ncbi:hypothetical protein PRIPAC_91614, partial [Pristionchus pacificus]|uniref:Fcf2 domain-containing protein n=1 Tax=Pristionchus pacificus TaxID=54126 RepID=A0A2A6CHV7_PRIPA
MQPPMRLLKVRPAAAAAAAADSSDSEDERNAALPVNKNFRCAIKDRREAKPAPTDFFSLDTTAGEEVSDDEEMEEEGGKVKKERFFLKDKATAAAAAAKAPPAEVPKEVSEALAKSVIRPGFESTLGAGASLMSKRQQKRAAKTEREKTTGTAWFDMPATEMTDERKADLELLSMRATLDPKRFYRKNDRAVLPKYFQVGRVVEDKRDFYGGRLTKAERKKNMLDEMMKTDGEQFTKSQSKYEVLRQSERKKQRGAFQKSGPINKKKMRNGTGASKNNLHCKEAGQRHNRRKGRGREGGAILPSFLVDSHRPARSTRAEQATRKRRELLILMATLTVAAAAYYYFERAYRAPATTPSASSEEALYKTDQSIAGSIDLFASSPSFTTPDDKRSPHRRYRKPHLISLPDRSHAGTPNTCRNPAHAMHPTHQPAARTAPTQDSCGVSPTSGGVDGGASPADIFDSSLTLSTCGSETELELHPTQ